MNKRLIVIATALIAIAGFAVIGYLYTRSAPDKVAVPAIAGAGNNLVRPSSPVLGPVNARVTIVEFFDPACESCRAYHPVVKQIMAEHPNDVRLVLRYAPFHQESEEAVRILEAARLQDKFKPVLDALFETQPVWAAGAWQLQYGKGVGGGSDSRA